MGSSGCFDHGVGSFCLAMGFRKAGVLVMRPKAKVGVRETSILIMKARAKEGKG